MKLLILWKRKYMNHDVIKDRYGRLYHLPYELSLQGHDIYCVCLSYQNAPRIYQNHQSNSPDSGIFDWYSWPAGLLGLKIPNYLRKVLDLISSVQPSAIIGGSDALHAILTRYLAHKTRTPYFLDLYDNFESFGLYRLPGIPRGYAKALQDARGISTVSKALKRHIHDVYPNKQTLALESTISPEQFKPNPKAACRQFFQLPTNAFLIGTAGSLSAGRDTGTLYEAFKRLHATIPQARLVLAGPVHGNPPPEHPGILYLGELPHQQIPKFISALDLAVICMNNDKFGRYAFPQKAYEILACNTPVVAAKVGPLEELFAECKRCLYQPGNIENLKNLITDHYAKRSSSPPLLIPSWSTQAEKLSQFLNDNL